MGDTISLVWDPELYDGGESMLRKHLHINPLLHS